MIISVFPKKHSSTPSQGLKAKLFARKKIGSARLNVYTTHAIRAGLGFQERVPILPVLGHVGLPIQ